MEIMDAIHSRGSVKTFLPDPVERQIVEKLIDAAVRAPNHKLTEPWLFYVITGESKRRFAELRRTDRAKRFEDPDVPEAQKALDKAYESAMTTPVIIAVATHVAEDPVRREEDYAATFVSIQNILLAALSFGLGTYLRTGTLLDDPGLHELLALQEDHRVVGTIYLGYPAEETKLKPRKPASEVTSWLE